MNIIPALWCRELLFILCLIISSDDRMISTTIPYFPTTTSFTSIANQIAKEQNNDSTIYSKGISTETVLSQIFVFYLRNQGYINTFVIRFFEYRKYTKSSNGKYYVFPN